ncbi:MAG: hypothetical protein AB7L91_16775 [Dehalococcoidia bacterium]
MLYGYGWLVLAQFYGSFEVNPEDVGVTFAFITVRVALVMAVLATGLAAIVLPLSAFGRARFDGTRLPRTDSLEFVHFPRAVLTRLVRGSPPLTGQMSWKYLRTIWAGTFALAILVAVLLQLLGVVDLEAPDPTIVEPGDVVAGWMFLAVLTAPVWAGLPILGIDALARRIRRSSISLRGPALLITGLLITGTVVVLVAGIWLLPRAMAESVRGRDLAASVPFLSLVGLRADSVQVTTVSGGPVSPRLPEGCVRLLGSANGVTVLFDPVRQLLVRVPSDHLLIERPCH